MAGNSTEGSHGAGDMYLSLQSCSSVFMVLSGLFAGLDLSCQLQDAHPGITQLLVHVLQTQLVVQLMTKAKW